MARILLIDDEKDALFAFRIGLERQGFKTETFSDPNEVISKFQPGRYHFAILDVKLDSTNGFELVKQLKALDPKLKFCFLTGYERIERVFGKEYEEFKNQ